jgi:hypothetical protein
MFHAPDLSPVYLPIYLDDMGLFQLQGKRPAHRSIHNWLALQEKMRFKAAAHRERVEKGVVPKAFSREKDVTTMRSNPPFSGENPVGHPRNVTEFSSAEIGVKSHFFL